jgi:sec-independent protein translocase protein TatA
MMSLKNILLVAGSLLFSNIEVFAFAPVISSSAAVRNMRTPTTTQSSYAGVPPSVALPFLQRQRKSVANVQTMGLFGLGIPEIGIILVAAAFLLGPDKLAEFGRDAGKIAGELKEVPKEFQKGLEEGETNARATKAKSMEELPQEIAEKK